MEALQITGKLGFSEQKHNFTNEDSWIATLWNPPWAKGRPASVLQVSLHVLEGQKSKNHFNSAVDFRASGKESSRVMWDNDITMNLKNLANEGQLDKAVQIIDSMIQGGNRVPITAFSALLQECGRNKALFIGKQVHSAIQKTGFKSNILLLNCLVDMYGKCGSVLDARQVFDEMTKRNMFTWTAIISAYAKQGQGEEAFKLFEEMQKTGLVPDKVMFMAVLQGCANSAALKCGKQVHTQIVRSGLQSDIMVGNTLIDMYAKCGAIGLAREVFDQMCERSVVSWTVMIAGYAQQGPEEEAFLLFEQMQQQGTHPNEVTYVSILQACVNLMAVKHGQQVHAHIIGSGFEFDLYVGSTLVDMYAKCGSVVRAREIFNKICERNVVSWNAIIAGYVQRGLYDEALTLFGQMQKNGVLPDEITYASIINACSSLAALEEGKSVHAQLVRSGFEPHTFLGNTLIDFYSICGSIDDAWQVFDKMCKRDAISWTAMIAGYAQQGFSEAAFVLFEEMQQQDLKLDKVTFVSILKTCAGVATLEWGKQIHTLLLRHGIDLDMFVGSALLDMYVKCGSIEDALLVLNKMQGRDVVSWTAMIAGLSQQGLGEEALSLFDKMQDEGLKPDRVTYISVLQACASLVALERGKHVHGHIVGIDLEMDAFVGSALIDMYAKSGSLDRARQIFNKMDGRNVVSWNALIAGYAQQGLGKEALALFKNMLQEGLKPTAVTFISVLCGCSHQGLVDEGHHHFDSMYRDYGITPTLGHYNCMVDLLGRAGHMVEAKDFIERMPFTPSEVVWMTLINACRIYGNVELAKHAIERILELNPQNVSAYVLLSNIYAAAGRWDDKVKVRQMMNDRGVQKITGRSCIEVNNHLYSFTLDDTSHPLSREIYAELKRLDEEMKAAGYVPETSFVLHDVEEELKELSMCHHSEKIAIAFGLISTPPKTPLRIVKNLRVCGNCHTASGLISKMMDREILLRDANGFHHFKNGACSCGIYH